MKNPFLAICLILVVVVLISARWSSKAVNAPATEGVIQTPVDASLTTGLSMSAMIDQSDLIAIGSCVDTKSAWVDRRPLTLATISVAETLKGAEPGTITVALPGGIDANRKFPIAMMYPGAPRIVPGEDVFLFLTADTDAAGSYSVASFSQGKFSIVKDQEGKQIVTRDLTRTMLKNNNSIRRGSTDMMPLSSFKAQVTAAHVYAAERFRLPILDDTFRAVKTSRLQMRQGEYTCDKFRC